PSAAGRRQGGMDAAFQKHQRRHGRRRWCLLCGAQLRLGAGPPPFGRHHRRVCSFPLGRTNPTDFLSSGGSPAARGRDDTGRHTAPAGSLMA
ncbi:MAG: hypothetical protein LBG76_01555, partial [Treponema sp.]|nr:hypothetical protein [Treponema sp.]